MKKLSPLLERINCADARKKTLIGYSLSFACFAALVFGIFFVSNGRSLILAPDGLSQHAVVLGYYGQYLRTILNNIFVEHTFVIPMFDFSIGMGNDIVSTLHYYAIGDPLNLLSVFVPEAYTDYLYSALAILRMYLSGLTFSVYMLHRNSNSSAITAGAFAYAFSGFAMRAATVHPFFMTGMIYCPLIFLGIDRILEKKSPLLYISAVALIIMSNFYFAYMTCFMMIIYAAMRYFSEYKKAGFGHLAATVGKFAVYTVNGFLIPMIIFLPQIVNVLSTDRLNVDNAVPLLYSLDYYFNLFDAMTNPSTGSGWVAIGYTGIAVLSLFVCFIRAKKHKNIVVSFCLSVFAVCIPFCGHVLNGFAYVVNRWIWIMAFIGCAAITVASEELFELTDKEKKILIVTAAVYTGILCCISKSRSATTMLMLALMFIALCVILIADTPIIGKNTAKRVVSVVLVSSVFLQFCFRYDFREENQARNYVLAGDFYEIAYENTVAALVNKVDDGTEFFRYDDNNCAVNENAALMADTNSTAFYYSIANSNVSEFIQEIGLNYPIEQRWLNFDDRYILQMLSGCKYASGSPSFSKLMLFSLLKDRLEIEHQISLDTSKKNVTYYKSYYTHASASDSTYRLSELRYALPMGYTYDSVMSREEYEKLSPVQKQNVLLQAAVTDGVSLPENSEIRTGSVREYDVFELLSRSSGLPEGIQINGNEIIVDDSSAVIELKVEMPLFSECYLLAEGIRFTEISPYAKLREKMNQAIEEKQAKLDEAAAQTEEEADEVIVDPLSMKQLKRAELIYSTSDVGTVSSVNITAQSEKLGKSESMTYYTPKNQFYSGADTFMINLGCTSFDAEELSAGTTDTILIKFEQQGIYTLDSLKICYQSLEYVGEYYTSRTQDVLENVEITDCENTVRGTISLDETKILATQIPYSEGWTVTVDGEEAELLSVNTMFCGVLLDAGDHEIEFTYVTPNANIAVILSSAGIIMLAVTAIVWGRKKKKQISQDATESDKTE